MRKTGFISLVAVILTLLLGAAADRMSAQVVKGSISGAVLDSTGAVVPEAQITATNKENRQASTTKTASSGLFHLALLPIGTYDVEVTKSGFRKLVLNSVQVNSAQDTNLASLTLEVGLPTTSVEVSAAPAIVQSSQAQVTTSITSQLIDAFPGVGENQGLDTLALQIPGVVNNRDLGFSNTNGVGFAVNGIRGRNNDQQVDGQNNNDNSVGGPAIFVGDANFVQEYQVTTNNFGPEYGRNSGSVINNLLKSGTNSWHGSGYITEGNSALNTLSNTQKAFEGLTKVPHFNDEFGGGTLGGPLVKDRAFVFGGFSQEMVTGVQSVYGTGALTPTPTGLGQMAACFPGSAAVAALQAYGPYGVKGGNPTAQGTPEPVTLTAPDGSPCDVEMAGVQRTLSSGNHQYNAYLRFDVQGQVDHVYGRWLYQRLNFFNVDEGEAAAGYPVNVPSLGEDFAVSWSHTLSPSMVNEARLSYGRTTVEFGGNTIGDTVPGQAHVDSALARVSFLDPSLLGFGPKNSFPQGRIVNNYQAQDNWSYSRGRHQLKAGFNWTYQRSPNVFLPNFNGTFNFADYSDLGADVPTTVSITLGSPTLDFREHDFFAYVGDDWKIRPNLTVNLGLTWSYFTQASNLFHDLDSRRESGPNSFFDPALPLSIRTVPLLPTPKNNWGPSIGFAYTPQWGGWLTGGGKMVVRGGYRLTYDPSYYNIFTNMSSSAPQVLAQTITDTASTPLLAQPVGGAIRAELAPFLTLGVFDPRSFNQTNVSPDFRPDRVHQWSFGIQRELTPHAVVEGRYVGNHATNLFQSINANPRIDEFTTDFPGLFSGFTPCPADQAVVPRAEGRINCNEGVIRQRNNSARSDYNGLQVEFRATNLANQLTLRSAYSWSKTTDNASEIFATFAGGGTVAFSQNPLDFVHGEHGLSGLDIPENWTVGFSEAIPAYRDQRGTVGHILGGWGIAGSYIISSGQPFSPTQFLLNGTYYDLTFNNAFNSGAEGLRPFVSNASAPVNQVGIFAADACGDYGLGCSLATNTLLSLNAINASGFEKTVANGDVRYIVSAPFADSQFGTPFGNAARNSLRDYHTNTANFTLFKQVALTERVRLMFDVSFINVFNHPSFGSLLSQGGIDPFVDDAGLTSELTGFATPTLFSGSSSDLGQRQIHFGLRVTF